MTDLNITHPEYDRRIFSWLNMRDAVEGEPAIKFKNTLYLPMPAAMAIDPTQSADLAQQGYYNRTYRDDPYLHLLHDRNPNWHRNAAYRSYLTRAQFPEIPSYVLRGMIGLTAKESPTIELPSELEYLVDDATINGLSLVEYFQYMIEEVLQCGRFGSAYDVDSNTGQLKFIPYCAESAINWQQAKTGKLSAVRLGEVQKNWFTEDDAQTTSTHNFTNLVEIRKMNGSIVVAHVDMTEGMQSDPSTYVPSYKGKAFEEFPFIFTGSLNNTCQTDPIPLWPVVSTSLQMYMKSADLSQSEFMSCSPMLVLTGAQKADAPAAIGSTVALTIANPDAKVYYTQTDTSALGHMQRRINELSELAIQQGLQLLDPTHRPAETVETVRTKQTAATATLISAVVTTTQTLNTQLRQMAKIVGASSDPESVSFLPDMDFLPPTVTAAEIREIVQSWINGAISQTTLLDNFRRASLLPEGVSPQDEMDRIKDEPLIPGTPRHARYEAFKMSTRGSIGPDEQTQTTDGSAPVGTSSSSPNSNTDN